MTLRKALYRPAALAAIVGLTVASQAAEARPKKNDKQKKGAVTVDYKLKRGATGVLCLDCHTDFGNVVDKPSVHTPVKTRKCTGCHNPHASNHGALLAADPAGVCASCHATLIPPTATSKHAPARDGKCSQCHDVHATDNAPLLLKPEQETCGDCHSDVLKTAATATRKHRPLEKDGCSACHDPHASSAPALLKKPVQELCADCHKVEQQWFAKMHNGYRAEDTNCVGCHAPHGSSERSMLHASVHAPVAKGACGQCHTPPRSGVAPETKKQGVELCRNCHDREIKAMLGKSRVHWALLDERACTNCHNPHASSQPKLISAAPSRVCGSCHADTIARHDRSPTKHKPVAGDCGKCHDPHSSDNVMMFRQASMLKLCGSCHNWRKHSTHPVGETLKDPRNPNLGITCTSCHRSHGTGYEHLIPATKTSELCVQCHQNFRR